jgi:hypothetical protein
MTKTNIAMPPAIPPTKAPTEVFALFAVVLFGTALFVGLCCVIPLVDDTDVVDGDTEVVDGDTDVADGEIDVVDGDTDVVNDDTKTVSSSVL